MTNPDNIIAARVAIVNRIREYADANNVSHQKIADAIGLHRSHITRVFSNKFPPKFDTIVAIALYLGLRVEVRKRS